MANAIEIPRKISIKHFESPSLFFFVYLDEDKSAETRFIRIQEQLRNFTNGRNYRKSYEPQVNEIVGFYHLKWQKFVRAKIESRDQNSFRIFLIDHGHYMTSSNLCHFVELPENLKKEIHRVRRGSLGLLPCEKIKDRKTLQFVLEPVDFWNVKAIKYVENHVNDKNSEFHFEKFDQLGQHLEIGRLIVLNGTGNFLIINEELVKYELAKQPGKAEIPPKLPTNFEKINEIVFKEEEKKEEKKSRQLNMLPAGIDFRNYVRNDVGRRKSPTKLPNPQSSKESDVEPPKSLPVTSQDPPKLQKTSKDPPKLPEFLQKAPRKLQETSQKAQNLRETLQSTEKLSKTSQVLEKLSKTLQDPEKLSKTLQDPEKLSKTAQNPEKLSKTLQDQHKLFKVLQDPEKLSKTPQDPEKLSKTLQDLEKLSKTRQDPPKIQETPQDPPKLQKLPDFLTKRKSSEAPPVPPPADIMVHGHRLIQPIQTIKKAPFKDVIKSKLKMELKILFQHSWPHIKDSRSMILITKDKREATLAYLPAVLDIVNSSVEPKAVIVARSSEDVKRIARDCREILPNLDLVTLFGANFKTVELINGCDVVIATPQALHRHIEECPVSFIDKNRVNCVVLDGVDLKSCDVEVKKILATCMKGRLSADGHTQLIFTSQTWSKEIETKLMSRVNTKNLVICVEDFIEAAACVGTKFNMKLSENFEGKLEELKKAVKFWKTLRTVVVTSPETVQKIAESLKEAKIQVVTADNENCQDVKRNWSNQPSVLITTDATLTKMELRSAQNLIHFNVPKNPPVFKSRFSSLLNQFYEQLEKKSRESSPVTSIFVDDENVLGFKWLIEFMQKRNLPGIPRVAEEFIQRFDEQMEAMKCENSTQICSRVFQFGECKKPSCDQRHVLTELDKSELNFPPKTTCTFELVSVEAPTTFIVKILNFFDGKNWVSRFERNEEIQNYLKNELQDLQTPQKAVNLNRGKLYAVEIDKIWHRCRFIEEESTGVARLNLIDTGKSHRVVSRKLFELPQRAELFEPLVFTLQIMNLTPYDDDLSLFKEEAAERLMNDLKSMAESFHFVSKVEFGIQNVLFAESFDSRDKTTSKINFRLSKILLKEKICNFDEGVGEKLKALAIRGGIFKEVEEKLQETPVEIEKLEEIQPEVEEIPKETWKQLSWQSWYEVEVKHYETPESFMVKLVSDRKKPKNSAPETLLKSFEVGNLCAVKGEEIRRGKITASSETEYDVLLVDSGEVLTFSKSDLLELPPEFLSTPFQSVHCRMLGVQPKFGLSIWPPLQRMKVKEIIRRYKEPLKMFVVGKNEKICDLNRIGMNSYNVLLMDPSGREYLDDVAVNEHIERAEVEKPEVEKPEIEEQIDSGHASEDFETDSDQAVLMEFVENLCFGEDLREEKEEVVAPPPMPPPTTLDFIHKRPYIRWDENHLMVKLIVTAVDATTYSLNLNATSLSILIKYSENRYEKVVLNFYALVNPKISSHDRQGNEIIVRLVKQKFYQKWPHLTESKEQSRFIRFDAEILMKEDEEAKVEQAKRPLMCYPDGFEESEDEEVVELSDAEL